VLLLAVGAGAIAGALLVRFDDLVEILGPSGPVTPSAPGRGASG
jgi:hypothetical protein